MKYAAIGLWSLVCVLLMPFTNRLHAKYNLSHIDFEKIPLLLKATDSITTTSNFNSVKVMDLRKRKDTIGYSMCRHSSYAFITDSLPQMIERVGARIIQPASVKQNQQLWMVVKDVFIATDDRKGSIHFRADFYACNAGQYQLLVRMDSVYEFGFRYDIRDYAVEYLNDIVTYSIIEYCSKTLPANEPVLDSAAIVNEEQIIKSHQPIYSEKPRDGVYYTYQDFIANSPSDTAFVYDPYYYYDVPAYRFYHSADNHKRGKSLADTNCYAICYKGKWYKNFGGQDFKQMKMEDGDYVFLLVLPRLLYAGEFKKPTVASPTKEIFFDAFRTRKPGKPKYNPQVYKMRIDAITGKMYKVESLPNYLNANSTTL